MNTIEIEIANVVLLVEFRFEYDAGYLYDNDGHGLPPSYELEIGAIMIAEVDVSEMMHCYAPQVMKAIEEQILESRI